MADPYTNRPVSAAMGLGLRVPSAGFNSDPSMGMGLSALRPTQADTAMVGTSIPAAPEQAIGGLRMRNAQQLESMMALPPIAAPNTNAQKPATAYFNATTNEMFAGDRQFSADDTRSALAASQSPGNTTKPVGPGWTALPEGAYGDYVASFAQRRGKMELIGRGIGDVAEGTIGGVGALMEFAGATEAGPAVRDFAQGTFGQSENEQLRDQLISQNSTLMEKLIDGTFRAIPSVASVVVGGGAVGLGARALGAGATAVRTAATIGGGASSFPLHVDSYYESAVQNGYDPTDPTIKTEIIGGALANTALDMFGISSATGKIVSRALRQTAEEAGKKAARSAIFNGVMGGAKTGFSEALTETMQAVGETALFDPKAREMWSAGELKALAPYLADTYGEQYLIAGGIGAILGGGMGTVANLRATKAKTDISGGDPVNLTDTAGTQTSADEAPIGEMFGPFERPMQGPMPLGEMFGPERPMQGPMPLGPMQGPAPLGEMFGPFDIAREGPKARILQSEKRQAAEAARGALADATLATTVETNAAARQQQRADRQAAATASGVQADANVAAQLAARGTRAGQLYTGNLLAAQQRFNTAKEALFAAQATGDKIKMQRAGAEYIAAENALTSLGTRVDDTSATALNAGDILPGPMQGPAPLGEMQGPAPLGEMQGPAPLGPMQGPAPLGPMQGPPAPIIKTKALTKKQKAEAKKAADAAAAAAAAAPMQGPMPLGPMQGPAPLGEMFGPPAPKALTKAQKAAAKKAAADAAIRFSAGIKSRAPVEIAATKKAPDFPAGPAIWATADGEIEVEVLPEPSKLESDGRYRQNVKLGDLGFVTAVPVDELRAVPTTTPPPKGTKGTVVARQGTTRARGETGEPTRSRIREPRGPLKQEAAPETQTPTPAPTPTQSSIYDTAPAPKRQSAFAMLQEAGPGNRTGGKAATAAENLPAALDRITAGPRTYVPLARKPTKVPLITGMSTREIAQRKSIVITPTAADLRPVVDPNEVQTVVVEPQEGMSGATLIDSTARVYETSLDEDERNDALAALYEYSNQRATKKMSKDEAAMVTAERKAAQEYMKNLSDSEKARAKQLYEEQNLVVANTVSEAVGTPSPVVRLGELLDAISTNTSQTIDKFFSEFAKAAAAVKKLQKEGNADALAATYQGEPILKYVNPQNGPKVVRGKLTAFALSDWNTISGAVDLNGKPIVPMSVGRIQLLVRNLASKLRNPPKTTVVKNQADLKARYPEVYARAVAERPQGDFDTANAFGYSSANGEVILFTDRIATEQQLRFVYAHETLGHFGLRGIISDAEFNSVMNKVYNSNKLIAAVIDQAVESRGMDRAEATEEYLADFAAVLDMSVLQRVGVAIKNALNKVGFKFSDDMVRYLVSQARRYVRNGPRGNIITTEKIFSDIYATESGIDTSGAGRFKQTFTSDNMQTDSLIHNIPMPKSLEDIRTALKPITGKSADLADKFLTKVWSLTTFRAMDNDGLSLGAYYVQKAGEMSNSIRNKAAATMQPALDMTLDVLGMRMFGTINAAERAASSRLAFEAQNIRRNNADTTANKIAGTLEEANKSSKLVYVVNGQVKRNENAIAAYSKAGRISLAEAKAILTADKRHKAIGEKLDENHPTWKSYEAMRDAYMEVELQLVETQYMSFLADRDIAVSAITEMLRPQNNTKQLTPADTKFLNGIMDKYYDLYTASAATKVRLKALKDAYKTAVSNNAAADIIASTNKAYLDYKAEVDKTTAGGTTTPKAESMADAEAFSATFNEAMIAKGFDTTKEDALRKFFDGKAADDVVASVQDLRKRMLITEQNKYTIQGKLREIGAAEVSNTDADLHARNSIVVGRTPIFRDEDNPYQTRVNAYDADGNIVQLEDGYKGLTVYRTGGTEAEMISIADQMQKIFSDTTIDPAAKDVKIVTKPDGTTAKMYTVSARDDKMSEFRTMEVELRAEVSRTVSGVASPLQTNVNEFVRGLRQFGIDVTPSKMEAIIVAMTAQNSNARRRLEQTGNPGYEVQGGIDAATSISRHVDTRAATIAKIALRPKLEKLMNIKSEASRKLWFGDKEKLKRLKDAYDAALSSNAPEGVVKDAKLEYFGYKHKMDKTIKVVNGREINQGNKYLSDIHSLLSFVNSNRQINESDWGSGPVASWVQRWAARAQLGGMMTQPIMNSIGPYTNFVPWLGTYNSKTGFGGGAGIAKAYAAYTRAFTDVGVGGMVPTKLGRDMNTAEYWDRVATGLEENAYVSKSEAQFIADETRSGIITPAMANSVIGNARGHSTNPLIEKATDAWMYFYQSSEQSTRRAAALAAFRIAWDRQLQKAGKTEAELAKSPDDYSKAFNAARDFATDGVNKTLGDYSAPNRPAAWRSGFQSFLYMYKVWTTTSVQTFARLDMTGKAFFLLPLLFASGLSGVPFAEDLEDLIDTLLQKTGTPIGSIRKEIAKQIDAVLPGWSGAILSGPGSALIGADVAGKFGLGDMAPATGMFLSGADIGTTFKEVAGPAFGFLSGLTTGGYLAATAPFSDTTTLVDALREGPITLGRAFGDGYAYMSSGAVIDKRGYVITPNASIDMLAARVLGFTPTSVASAYGIISGAKRETDYQKAKVSIFRQALLKAELSGDTKTAASIRQHVKEWNAATKGTILEIKDFEKNYRNLKKRAVMPATQRFLQSTSKNAQSGVQLAIDLYGYD